MYDSILTQLRDLNILYQSGKLNTNATRLILQHDMLHCDIKRVTDFLPPSVKFRERLYCIINNIKSRKTCACCSGVLSIKKSGKLEYPTYCSLACVHKGSVVKRKQTMLARYGVEYTAQNVTLQNKMKETCIRKYGVDNPLKNNKIQDSIKQTVRTKYGVSNVMFNDDIKRKHSIGCGARDYSISTHKRQQTTQSNNGFIHVKQRHLTDEQLELLNNRDWLYNRHVVDKLTLYEIAALVGVEKSTISVRFKQHNIIVNRFAHSVGERQVVHFLEQDLNMYVTQGNRSLLGGLELDVYVPSKKIAIEYCGLYWHADIHDRIDRNYHKRKHDMCRELGIQLITIYEDEWLNQRDIVTSKLRSIFGVDDRPVVYARKTSVVEVNQVNKVEFFNQYHIQHSGPGSVTFGLMYDNELVACMCFIKQQNGIFYLNRYATSCKVLGGFSKLLNHFKRVTSWVRLISFADQRWSCGNLYERTGWVLDSIINSDYCYSPDGKRRFHKFNYRRKHLPQKLETFDPALSEWQNCNNNGVLRIWDCGKRKYIMDNII